MRPLYIGGTQRDIGKTTMCIGLLHCLRRRGLRVAYAKPLGQQIISDNGQVLHDDARLVASILGDDGNLVGTAVPLPAGRVEKEIKQLECQKLLEKVIETYTGLATGRDLVIVEAMGHVAMGSCLKLSAADVSRSIGAKVLLVSGGGIGRAIDEICLCGSFLTSRGIELLGVVVNKVWPDKYDRVRQATTKGLANLGYKSYGTIPFDDRLVNPTMQQIHALIGGEVVAGPELLGRRVQKTVVAAMESVNMVGHLHRSTLVIMPGDRSDNILATITAHIVPDKPGEQVVSGIVLTCGFRPAGAAMWLIRDSRLPVILVEEDTYTVVSKIRDHVFKITPGDEERIRSAVRAVEEHVDVDGILDALEC